MKARNIKHRSLERGIVLLDALIAVVIFSIGILGMVTLQSNAVKYSSDAQYRTDAAMLADQVIGQMWTANPTTFTTTYAGAAGTGGTDYTKWNGLVAALPGGVGSVIFSGTNVATVTVTWQGPNDTAPHTYVSVTQVTN